MAKGGKKRTYVRDGNGRFASTPGSAAKKAAKSTSGRKGTLGARTGLKGSKAKLAAKDKADQTLQNTLSTRAQKGAVTRGSRKLAAAKVAARTRIGGGRKGVIGKLKGLKSQGIAARSEAKPKPAPKIDMKQAINKATQLRNKAKQVSRQAELMMGGGRKDGAIVNMSMNSRARQSTVNKGITGSRLAAQAEALNNKAGRVLDRAIASRKKAEREALKPAKKQRSAESLRISRAKQVEKRRSINITNPAGWREDAAAKMAANAARTQKRALDFYKQKGRAPKTPAPAPNSPTRTKGSRTTLPRTPGTVAKPKAKDRNEGSAKPKAMTESGPTSGKMYRTRKQSAAKQISKKKKLLTSVPFEVTTNDRFGTKTSVYRSPGKLKKNTLKIKTATSSQLNLLGGVDRVTTKAVSSGLREALPAKSTKNNNTNIGVVAPGSREVADFVSSKTPMAKSKAKLALRRLVSSDGTVTTREELIRKKINEGWSVKADSRDGHHLYDKKTSSFLTQKDITLTGIEYAKHLLSKKSNK